MAAEEFEFPVLVTLLSSGGLFKPSSFMEGGVPKYWYNVVLNKQAENSVTEVVERVAAEAKVKLKNSPFQHGNDVLTSFNDPSEELQDLLTGAVVFRAASQYPIVFYARSFPGGPIEATTDETKFYPGALVLPVVKLQAYKISAAVEGVTAYALSLYTTGQGKRFGGGSRGPKQSWGDLDPPTETPAKKKLVQKLRDGRSLDDEISF